MRAQRTAWKDEEERCQSSGLRRDENGVLTNASDRAIVEREGRINSSSASLKWVGRPTESHLTEGWEGKRQFRSKRE